MSYHKLVNVLQPPENYSKEVFKKEGEKRRKVVDQRSIAGKIFKIGKKISDQVPLRLRSLQVPPSGVLHVIEV